MNPTNLLQTSKNELKISDRIKITHLYSPSIAESHDGMMFSTLKLYGLPYETQSDADLIHQKQYWHRVIASLEDYFSLHITLRREKVKRRLSGDFSCLFCQKFDREYQDNQGKPDFYENYWYLTLVIDQSISSSRKKTIFGSILTKSIRYRFREAKLQQAQKLISTINQVKVSLKSYHCELLGEKDEHLGYSELLEFLSSFMNFGSSVKVKSDQFPFYDRDFKDDFSSDSIYPTGNISQSLSKGSIYFGQHIEFKGPLRSDTRHAIMLSLKTYLDTTAPSILDALLTLPCEFIQVNTFSLINKQFSLDSIKKHINKMIAINDPSHSQIEQLQQARDDVQSDRLRMGRHHQVMLIFSDTIERLERALQSVVSCYSDVGFIVVRETLGLESAFWSMLPTHLNYVARSAMINSLNFVDFCSFHDNKSGYFDCNHLGRSMSIVQTSSLSPFYFNLHTQGSKQSPSSGHTLIIGGNGSGKTVTMCFCDSQLARYGGRSFFFDRDNGCEIYIRACHGCYLSFTPSSTSSVKMNPFHLESTPENILFVKSWMKQLVLRDNESHLDKHSEAIINDAVDYAFTHLHPSDRRLSTVSLRISPEFKYWDRLRRWLYSKDRSPDGEYAYLFDNIEDDLQFSNPTGFDLTHFMDNEPGPVFIALLMYLFHRIERCLNGELVSIFLDEGWQYLNHTYWRNKLKHWLPTLRKRNAHIILSTQSAQTVIKSSIAHILLDNSSSQLYFPNAQAQACDYIEGFNLSEREFFCLKKISSQTHYFLFKQANDSTILRFPLMGMNDYLKVFSSSASSVKYCRELISIHGDNPDAWLPQFMGGVPC